MDAVPAVRTRVIADWSDAALGRLRARVASPAAWVAFLRDAVGRWRSNGESLPGLRRSLRRWLFSCAVLTTLARMRATGRLPGLSSLLWIIAAWLMGDWHLGMIPRPSEQAGQVNDQQLGLANRLTLLRGFLPAAVLGLTSRRRREAARVPVRRLRAIVAWTALLTDILDGLAARRLGDRTYFGTVADPSADAAVWTILVLTGQEGRRNRFLVWIVCARFLIPPILIALITFGRGRMVEWQRSNVGRWSSALLGIVLVWREQAAWLSDRSR